MRLSVILLAYQQEDFIEQAVHSVLAQTERPFEIILSDDCSSDATFEIMQEIAGRAQSGIELTVRRNSENLGITSHLNLLMNAARGDVVMVCAGDDISLKKRSSLTLSAHRANPRLAAAAFAQEVIDETGAVVSKGKPSDGSQLPEVTFESYLRKNVRHPSAASRSYSAKIYEAFGPLSASCPSEDSPMLLRALLLGDFYVSPDVVLQYRRHGKSLTNFAMASRSAVADLYNQHRADLERAKKLRLIEGDVARNYDLLLEKYWARRRMEEAGFHDGPFGIISKFLKEKAVPAREKVAILRRALGQRRRLPR